MSSQVFGFCIGYNKKAAQPRVAADSPLLRFSEWLNATVGLNPPLSDRRCCAPVPTCAYRSGGPEQC
jgi:hypothetical protein